MERKDTEGNAIGVLNMARAKRKTNIRFMMRFIKEIIDGESDRLNFDLDFNYHLIQRYDKMYNEDPEATEVIAEYVGDLCDRSDEFTDDELRDKLIDAYELIEDVLNDTAY